LLFQPLGSLPAEGPGSEGVRLLRICFFNPSAPFPPKARGRRGFDRFTKRSGLNTFSEAIVVARADRHPVEEVVHLPVWTITRIVEECCGGAYPPLLSMDLEGLDLAVLKTADFSLSRPRVVIAELQGADAAEARPLMANWGFRVLCRMVSNLLFVHDDWIGKVS
jgi:hypothetical protein